MSDYFMLACYAPPGSDYRDLNVVEPLPGVDSWQTGARFDADVTGTVRLAWDPETEGFEKALYTQPLPLFRRDVLGALREAGVDNLDAYPAAIVDPGAPSAPLRNDYSAVNIIGAISAADLSASVYTVHSPPPLVDVDFDALAIDAPKALGMKLFRLAECVTGIVVHRSVKEHLEMKGGFGLTFVPPADWIG